MRKPTTGLIGLVTLFTALSTPAAAATPDSFSCSASAARVVVPAPLGTFEPIRANAPRTPCAAGSVSVVYPTVLGPASADAVGAFTARQGTGPGSAFASANHAAVTLPGFALKATTLEATATSSCTGTTPANASTSRVVGLVINDSPVVLPPNDAPFTQAFGPVTVSANKEIVEGTTLTRRAIEVVAPQATIVLGEAFVGHGAGACQPDPASTDDDDDNDTDTDTDTGGGGGGNDTNNNSNNNNNNNNQAPGVCPQGAEYDASRNVCVIREGDNVIVVGPPFSGPSGGTVMSLPNARKLSKSPCLKGSGPKFAIVGSNKADRITGTNDRDRIILRGGRDNAEGGRGDDCIDGGKGADTMSGALGKDKILGRSGGDHLVGGSAADNLKAGSGNDTINSGFGRDRIDAGKGRDRINAATAGPASKSIKCGKGRGDKIRVNRNEKRKAKKRRSGCEIVYVIR